MKLKFVKPAELKPASYNPKIRTNTRFLNGLKFSIEKKGILVPLMVDNNLNIIDGHRRLTCAKQLKLNTVPVIVQNSNLSKDDIYEDVNRTQRKISTKEMIYIYVNGGKIPQKALKAITRLEAIIGKKSLRRLGNDYSSYSVLSQGTTVAKYCRKETPDFLKKTILWLVDKKQSYAVRKAMEGKVKDSTLINAVNQNRPLQNSWN